MNRNSKTNLVKKNIRGKKNALLFCLFIITVVFGYIGIALTNRSHPSEAMSFSESTYRILQMFVLNYGPHAYNNFTNIARFTGAVFSAGVILSFAWKYLVHLSEHIRVYFSDSVIIYGNNEESDFLLSQLGWKGILLSPESQRFLKGRRYILMSSEEDNFRFLEEHEFSDKAEIWLKTETLPGIMPSDKHIDTFSFEEIAAQHYWQEYPLYEDAFDSENKPLSEVNVVLIGLGRMGKELLYSGVQVNAFDPDQKVVYHVLADADETASYAGSHDADNLKQLHIILDQTTWTTETGKKIIADSDRVILLEQNDQADCINGLLSLYPDLKLDVFTSTRIPSEVFRVNRNGSFHGRLRFFDWMRQTDTLSEITRPSVLQEAKQRNYRYACEYGQTYSDPEEAWNALDNFKRYSNVRTVLFDHIMANCINCYWKDMNEDELKQKLIRLEHCSWMNYYLISNWHYGPVRNDSLRIHPDIVPFDQLTQKEKNKDMPSAEAMIAMSRKLQKGEK